MLRVLLPEKRSEPVRCPDYDVLVLRYFEVITGAHDVIIIAQPEFEIITEIDELKDSLQLMITIITLPCYVQHQINLGRCRPSASSHRIEITGGRKLRSIIDQPLSQDKPNIKLFVIVAAQVDSMR